MNSHRSFLPIAIVRTLGDLGVSPASYEGAYFLQARIPLFELLGLSQAVVLLEVFG